MNKAEQVFEKIALSPKTILTAVRNRVSKYYPDATEAFNEGISGLRQGKRLSRNMSYTKAPRIGKAKQDKRVSASLTRLVRNVQDNMPNPNTVSQRFMNKKKKSYQGKRKAFIDTFSRAAVVPENFAIAEANAKRLIKNLKDYKK